MRRGGGLLAAALAMLACGAQAQPLPEAAVKAAFLAKFLPYVDLPAARPETLVICMVGRDPFGPAVDRAAGAEQAGGQMLTVRRMPAVRPDSGCHLAFLGGSGTQSVDGALRSLQGSPVITVTDARLSRSEGMIHFAVVNGRVRFSIDDAMAARSRLVISSKLLSLAVRVRQRERG